MGRSVPPEACAEAEGRAGAAGRSTTADSSWDAARAPEKMGPRGPEQAFEAFAAPVRGARTRPAVLTETRPHDAITDCSSSHIGPIVSIGNARW